MEPGPGIFLEGPDDAAFSGDPEHSFARFVVVEIGETPRELLNLQLGRGGAGLTPIPGSRYSAIRVDDHWPSARCNACGAYPVIYLRYDGFRLVADPELMRQPAPFRPHLESDAHRIREGHERDGTESFEEEVTSTVVDLVYSGNLDSACAFLSLAWPEDWKAEMDGTTRRAFFDSLLAKFPTDSDGRYPGLGQALAKLNGVSSGETLRCR